MLTYYLLERQDVGVRLLLLLWLSFVFLAAGAGYRKLARQVSVCMLVACVGGVIGYVGAIVVVLMIAGFDAGAEGAGIAVNFLGLVVGAVVFVIALVASLWRLVWRKRKNLHREARSRVCLVLTCLTIVLFGVSLQTGTPGLRSDADLAEQVVSGNDPYYDFAASKEIRRRGGDTTAALRDALQEVRTKGDAEISVSGIVDGLRLFVELDRAGATAELREWLRADVEPVLATFAARQLAHLKDRADLNGGEQ